MSIYIIDNKTFKVYSKRKDMSCVNMSDEFAHTACDYTILRGEDEAYEYWDNSSKSEGLSEDMKHEMFKEWLNE